LTILVVVSLFLTPPLHSELPKIASPLTLAAKAVQGPYIRTQGTEFITYEELKSLSLDPTPKSALKKRLEKFWRTPIINNEAYYSGVKPHSPKNFRLGSYLRVVSWNIEKSFHIDEVSQLLLSEASYNSMINPEKIELNSQEHQDMLRQRKKLLNADIVLFQEMEIGLKRSKYYDSPAKLAKVLKMNYAFAPQYLEVDPIALGTEELEFEDESEEIQKEAREFFSVDPARYKGVFGSAVLSRYPIKHVELRPLKTMPYDWYWGEQKKVGITESVRRAGAKGIFKNVITRELKVGNRHFFRVDLEVPGLPNNTLTVINIHLEIKCQPKGRQAEMTEILSYVRDIKNPVIMMGDYNMSPTDISPTTAGRILKRTASSPTTWFSVAMNVISPHALIINTSRFLSNFTKNLNDPTVRSIPVVAPNPTRPFFDMMEDFRFTDGGAFDFRGDQKRSMNGKIGTLSNANQRGKKGFVTSFRVLRPIGIVGKYRLDWVFVKSFLKQPRNEAGSYRFAPHFGETLEAMNFNLTLPVSDHAPNVIDLPFQEPNILRD